MRFPVPRETGRGGLGWLLLGLLGCLVAGRPVQAGTREVGTGGSVVWELTPPQAGQLLDQAGSLEGLELVVRVRPDARHEVASILAALAARGALAGVLLDEDWLASPVSMVPGARTVVLVVSRPGSTVQADEQAFRLKTLATELRARGAVAIGFEGDEPTREVLWARGVAAYVDFLVASATDESPATASGGLEIWRRFASALRLGAVVSETLRGPGRILVRWGEGADRLAPILRRLGSVLPADLSPLTEVTARCDPERCESRVFLDPRTGEALGLLDSEQPLEWITVSPGAERVELCALDEPSGPLSLGSPELSHSPVGVRLYVGDRRGPLLLKIAGWNSADQARFHSQVEVTAQPLTSVEEVIARHQARAARDRQDLKTLISSGSMVLTFQVRGLAAPVTVSADMILYAGGDATEVEQRSIRLNGASLGDSGVPRLPLIEPERVIAPPLAITLNEAYSYRLDGRDVVRGQECYVVGFEPRRNLPLFRGRAWIAVDSFGIVRIDVAQTGLRGPIVSSEQRDEFRPITYRDRTIWLLARSSVYQVYEGAGHRTSIERSLRIERHEPEPPDFASRLSAAHSSSAVMLKDTPEGYRYLRREESGGEVRRVLAGRAERVRTATFGALLDPGIDGPVPFAGLGYLDFDFLGTGTQVTAFLGGAFVSVAGAVPSLGGSRWQLHASAFWTFVEYNDRVFRRGIERYEENLRQRPARGSLGLVKPLSVRSRVKASYEIGYARLARSPSTAEDFVEPVSPLEHGLRLALEVQAGAWTTSFWWNPAWRQRWEPWGLTGNPDFEPGPAGLHRYGASAFRSVVLSRRAVGRIEVGWMGGRHLDRFSRYGFDQFENVLHGYPSASLRYDRGGVVRSALCWTAGPGLRLSAFVDGAHVRDPGFGPRARPYVGVGSSLEAPLPWGLRLVGEWGYGFQGRDREGRRGTHVVRLTGYRIF